MSQIDATQMLIERLNWPLRLVRWKAARELGNLIDDSRTRRATLEKLLTWIESRELESEVTSGLAVFFCTDSGHPSYSALENSIKRPSLLSDMMMYSLYGKASGRWANRHSGQFSPDFRASNYFIEHKGAHCPPILGTFLARVSERLGEPLIEQWAYEWSNLRGLTDAPYTGFPYFFCDSLMARSGITAQVSQRQCALYRSAYLRTLAFAVENCGLPENVAKHLSLVCLPLNKGLANLSPVSEPNWLPGLLSPIFQAAENFGDIVAELIHEFRHPARKRIVSLVAPFIPGDEGFAELRITAVLATKDFTVDGARSDIFGRSMIFPLSDGMTVSGPLPATSMGDYVVEGTSGYAAPICLSMFPDNGGYWHNDYLQACNLMIPAPHFFSQPPAIRCSNDKIELRIGNQSVSATSVWHREWSPMHPRSGNTNCGSITVLHEGLFDAACASEDLRVGWVAERRVWHRPDQYGEFQLKLHREFITA